MFIMMSMCFYFCRYRVEFDLVNLCGILCLLSIIIHPVPVNHSCLILYDIGISALVTC